MSNGSIEVGSGYYNADGTNKIIFENPVGKDFEDIGGNKGFKNNIVLTLDNSDVSSFILQGVEAVEPTGYKATKALDKFVYLNNNKDKILGDSPKGGLDVQRCNFNIEGSPTITSEYVTGFSDTDRLTIKDYLLDTTSSFEVVVPFSLDSASTSNCSLIDKEQAGSKTNFRLEVNPSNKIQCRLFNIVESAEYFATLIGTTTLSLNTRYWAKVVYSSSTGYSLQLSTDGINYSEEARSSVTTLIGKTNTSYLIIGDNSATGSSFPGKIYFNGFKIYVNGNLVWKPSPNSLYVSKGYVYVDETSGNLEVSNEFGYTPQEFVVHGEDFEEKEISEKVYNEPEIISQGSYGFQKVGGILNLSNEYTSVYQSTNKGQDSTNAISKIVFNEPGEVTIWINSYAESKYDYAILSAMDAASALTDVSGSVIDTKDFQHDPRQGLSTNYWRKYTATIPDDGVSHHFWITYVKDSSTGTNDDRGYFVVKKNFRYVPINTKQGYLSLGKVEGETKLIATGMRNPTASYTGSSVTPADIEKKVYLSEDLTEVISVEGIA